MMEVTVQAHCNDVSDANAGLQSTSDLLSHQLVTLRQTQSRWAEVPISQRIKILGRFRRALLRNASALITYISDQSAFDIVTAELLPLLSATRFLERASSRLLRDKALSVVNQPLWLWGVKTTITRKPLGVVLILAPGNYPLMLAGIQTLQALVAGNTVALKPAPGRTAVLTHFASLLAQSGLPDGTLQILPEDAGPEACRADVDLIVLTGSANTGRQVALAAADNLTPTIMELSGADPVYVLPSGSLSLVTRALHFGLSLKQGATCIAPRRVFVEKTRRDALEARLISLLKKAPLRDQTAPNPALDALLSRVIAAGGKAILIGGATVFVLDAKHTDLVDIDLFAPWLALISVTDMDQALALERQAKHALGASIFGNEDEATALARHLPAGTITINDLIVPSADPRLAFGGAKSSGYGVTRGREGLLAMTRPASIAIRRRGALHLIERVRRWHSR